MPRQKSQEVQRLERQISNLLRREADTVKSLWEEIHRERLASVAACTALGLARGRLDDLAIRDLDRSLDLGTADENTVWFLVRGQDTPRAWMFKARA